jgi:hypothetical protein
MYDYELVSEFHLLEELTVGFSPGVVQISLEDPREATLAPRLL